MDFGPIRTPRGADVGSAPTSDAAAAAARRPADAASSSPTGANQASAVAATAAQAVAGPRPANDPEMRTVGDVQRLAGFLRSTAEELAASEAGNEGEGSGGGAGADFDPGVIQMMASVERHAEKVFRSILEFAGEDRKLLEQARGFVAKVFEEFRHRDPEPMLARLTHERVIEMIESRLREMTDGSDVDFSA